MWKPHLKGRTVIRMKLHKLYSEIAQDMCYRKAEKMSTVKLPLSSFSNCSFNIGYLSII